MKITVGVFSFEARGDVSSMAAKGFMVRGRGFGWSGWARVYGFR